MYYEDTSIYSVNMGGGKKMYLGTWHVQVELRFSKPIWDFWFRNNFNYFWNNFDLTWNWFNHIEYKYDELSEWKNTHITHVILQPR